MGLSRRRAMAALGLSLAVARTAPTRAAARSAPGELHLAAAWESAGQHRIGLLALKAGGPVRELMAIDVPTRAHGVWVDHAVRLVAVARRPGDWLLRWAGPGSAPQWRWIEPDRAFNGHVLASVDGQRLYTTETDLDTGAGLIGVRDARTLAKLDEWPSHGLDPHQLLWDRIEPGHLVVANGDVATSPETGRVKHGLARMDSSLVRLDARTGRLAGQWRLGDARLSLRHLAWSSDGACLGIALQAEHDDAAVRANAPVLAVFDGRALTSVEAPRSLAGYGGDIAASTSGFAVSCPRAHGVAHFSTHPSAQSSPSVAWHGFTPLPEACALAACDGSQLWAGGRPNASLLLADGGGTGGAALGERRLDNHWSEVPARMR
jgi:hypothetical protein